MGGPVHRISRTRSSGSFAAPPRPGRPLSGQPSAANGIKRTYTRRGAHAATHGVGSRGARQKAHLITPRRLQAPQLSPDFGGLALHRPAIGGGANER